MNEQPIQVLLTGGTGSFGQTFVRRFLEAYENSTIRIFSRDELKQYEMGNTHSETTVFTLKPCHEVRLFGR